MLCYTISMIKRVTKQKIKQVSDKIAKEYKPEKIILFGSYAWGKPTSDSDVDLFIIKQSRKRQIDRMRELRKKLFRYDFPPLDLLVYTPQEMRRRISIGDFFIGDIISKGKVLYER